jgi:hypothetical protein
MDFYVSEKNYRNIKLIIDNNRRIWLNRVRTYLVYKIPKIELHIKEEE